MGKMLLLLLVTSLGGFAQEVDSFRNGNIQLFYEQRGKGPALYILTGGPGAPPEYPSYQLMDSLQDHYTCVLLHQRGSGRSRNIPIHKGTINIRSYTQDIELLRQRRGDDQITLLGISWGGLLAMNYAAEHPTRVANLVLLCSAPPSYKLWPVLNDNQFNRRSVAELDSMQALQRMFSGKSDAELDRLMREQPQAPEAVAFRNFLALHVRAMHYDRSKAALSFDRMIAGFNFQPIPIIDQEVVETRWDITDKLRNLSIPALILYGRQDDQGESTFYLQQACLRNSDMRVIEQCGHIMWEDQPEQFYGHLMQYLTRRNR